MTPSKHSILAIALASAASILYPLLNSYPEDRIGIWLRPSADWTFISMPTWTEPPTLYQPSISLGRSSGQPSQPLKIPALRNWYARPSKSSPTEIDWQILSEDIRTGRLSALSLVGIHNPSLGYEYTIPQTFLLEMERSESVARLQISISGSNLQRELISVGRMNALTSLDCAGSRVTSGSLMPIAQLKKLEVLDVSRTHIDDAAVDIIEQLVNLRSLNISHTRLSGSLLSRLHSRGLIALAAQRVRASEAELSSLSQMQQLTHLDISDTAASDDTLNALRLCASLTSLRLNNTHVTDAGLARNGGLDRLKLLSIDNTAVKASGMKAVGELRSLSSLSVSGCHEVTDEMISQMTNISAMRELDLSMTSVSNAVLQGVRQAKDLRVLSISGTGVGDEGMAHLAVLDTVEVLDLSGTQVSDLGLVAMGKQPKLMHLNLSGLRLGHGILFALSDRLELKELLMRNCIIDSGEMNMVLKTCRGLETLHLTGTAIDDDVLKTCSAMQRLRTLDISECPNVTWQGVQSLSHCKTLRELVAMPVRGGRISEELQILVDKSGGTLAAH
jgi:internalin A